MPLPTLTYNGFNVSQQKVASGRTIYSVFLPVLNYAPKTVERYELAMLHKEIDKWIDSNF